MASTGSKGLLFELWTELAIFHEKQQQQKNIANVKEWQTMIIQETFPPQ